MKSYILMIANDGKPTVYEIGSAEGIAALVSGLTEAQTSRKKTEEPREKTIDYVNGFGITGTCPYCGRHVEVGASDKVEEERPTHVNLPCGCTKVAIEYKGFETKEEEEIEEASNGGRVDKVVPDVGHPRPRRKTTAV